jgi:hypothetical protein
MGNCTSPQARWRKGDAMAAHDRLPPELRRFVIHAELPWSARSVLAVWQKALRAGHCPARALAVLDRAARATLAREVAKVWGPDHPAARS